MPSIRLHTRRDALCALFAAAVATLCALGGVLLFVEAERTPALEAGSTLAQRTLRCRYESSPQAHHQCVRDIAAEAALPARNDASLAESPSADPTRP